MYTALLEVPLLSIHWSIFMLLTGSGAGNEFHVTQPPETTAAQMYIWSPGQISYPKRVSSLFTMVNARNLKDFELAPANWLDGHDTEVSTRLFLTLLTAFHDFCQRSPSRSTVTWKPNIGQHDMPRILRLRQRSMQLQGSTCCNVESQIRLLQEEFATHGKRKRDPGEKRTAEIPIPTIAEDEQKIKKSKKKKKKKKEKEDRGTEETAWRD